MKLSRLPWQLTRACGYVPIRNTTQLNRAAYIIFSISAVFRRRLNQAAMAVRDRFTQRLKKKKKPPKFSWHNNNTWHRLSQQLLGSAPCYLRVKTRLVFWHQTGSGIVSVRSRLVQRFVQKAVPTLFKSAPECSCSESLPGCVFNSAMCPLVMSDSLANRFLPNDSCDPNA